jgi:DNA-binding transcriptional MerR regulator
MSCFLIGDYIPCKEASEKLGVNLRILRNWSREGKIKTMRTPSGKRFYDVKSFLEEREKQEKIKMEEEKSKIICNKIEGKDKIIYNKMEGEEILFNEPANIDEEEMCFGHPNNDGYSLYRFPIPEPFDFEEVCRKLFHQYRNQYEYIKYNMNELYDLRQNELKERNEALNNKFEYEQLNLKDIMIWLTYDDIFRVPTEFDIWVKKGKYISNMEDDVAAVFIGEGYIYYYEYRGCPWPH